MAVFEYTAKNSTSGQILKGTLDVPSKDEVMAYLRKNKMLLVSVREQPKKFEFKMPGGGGVGTRDIVIFTRQFATMINSGLPLVQSLTILAEQTENKRFKVIIAQVLQDIQSGQTLADSLRRHPKVFTELYVNMVAAGEAGGILDVILNRLAVFLERTTPWCADQGRMSTRGDADLGVLCTTILLWKVVRCSRPVHRAGLQLPMPRAWVWRSARSCAIHVELVLGVSWRVRREQYHKTDGGSRSTDDAALPVRGTCAKERGVARHKHAGRW